MYVFALTTGRSGSLYLATILASCPDTHVEHQPSLPDMDVQLALLPAKWYVHTGDLYPVAALLRDYRLPFINGLKGEDAHYVETSPAVTKAEAFAWPLVLPKDGLAFIHLRKSAYATILSHTRAGLNRPDVISMFFPITWPWPWAPYQPFALSTDTYGKLDDFDIALWSWLNVEAIAVHCRKSQRVVTVELEDLNTEAGVFRLCDTLGLPPPTDTTQVGIQKNSIFSKEHPVEPYPEQFRGPEHLPVSLAKIRAMLLSDRVASFDRVVNAVSHRLEGLC